MIPVLRRIGYALVLACLFAAPSGAAYAHYVDLRGKLVADGVLTFGVALTGRPFAYRQDGALRGFEIDWAREVAHSRGLELDPVQLPRDRLIPALRSGAVDLVNSFPLDSALPADLELVAYLRAGEHMLVLKGNPFGIARPEDLAGHVVSATAGGAGEDFAREINRRLIAAGHAPLDVHSFPLQRDVHFPVSMGHAAAYFAPTRAALVASQDPDSRVRLVDGVFRPGREVGFALRKDDTGLQDAIRHGVAAKVANGAYDRLRAAHGLPDVVSPFR